MKKYLPRTRTVRGLPRWRQEQKERKTNKTLRFVLACLLLIILIILVGFGYKIYGTLSRSIWDGKNQINLVFNSTITGQPVLVASFNPQEKSLNTLIIPGETLVEVIQGYGLYRVESIYSLGELEGKGGLLLAGSIQEYFGLPIDGWVAGHKSKRSVNLVTGAAGSRNYFIDIIVESLKEESRTNLARWDLVRLWWEIRGVRQDRIKMVDLGETSASEEVVLPDGTKAIKIDPQHLEQIISEVAVDEKIRKEDLAIAVLNATNQPGLATKGSRLIRNIGGRVIGIGETENFQFPISNFQCQIRSKKNYKNSYTVKRLSKIFNCDWGGEDLEGQRAQVVLIIGR
jgi:hypothetical protein